MGEKAVRETKRVSRGVELVQHHHTGQPRVRVWVQATLQPKQYNSIQVGASLEDDVPKGKVPSTVVNKSFAEVLKTLESQVKKAFAKLGFKF